MKEFIGIGKTIEEATAAAKVGLGAPTEAFDNGDVKIEIVEMPKKKVLGLFGGSDAKVKASYDDAPYNRTFKSKSPFNRPVPTDKPQAQKKSRPKNQNKPAQKKHDSARAENTAAPVKAENIDTDALCAYIKTIIDGFKVENASVTAALTDNAVEVTIECDDYGIIIGRRGETLDAIQYLASLALKNQNGKYTRVAINIGDYREKREATLKALAIKNANYVVRSGRRYVFEPMNPYERRIIHTAVQEVEGAVSRSVGSGDDRKVLIEPEGGVRVYSDRRRPSDRGGRGRGRSRGYDRHEAAPADPNRERHVDRADIPKFGKIEVNNNNED